MTVADRARAERLAQGLPEKIEDATALARVATLIVYGLRTTDDRGCDD